MPNDLEDTTKYELDAREQTGVSTDSLTAAENEQRVGHTPGPWFVGSPTVTYHDYPNRYVSESVSVHSEGYIGIASVGGGQREKGISVEEGRANARLIAAAPDLLAALKASQEELVLPRGCALRLQIETAIAKAEGR